MYIYVYMYIRMYVSPKTFNASIQNASVEKRVYWKLFWPYQRHSDARGTLGSKTIDRTGGENCFLQDNVVTPFIRLEFLFSLFPLNERESFPKAISLRKQTEEVSSNLSIILSEIRINYHVIKNEAGKNCFSLNHS